MINKRYICLVFCSLFFTIVLVENSFCQNLEANQRQWASNTVIGSVGAYQIFGLGARYERNLLPEGKNNMAVGATVAAGFIGQVQIGPHFTYLLGFEGNKRSFLELGVGLPVLIGKEYDDPVIAGISTPVGYRYQQIEKGWAFRVGLSPSYFPQLRNDSDTYIGLAIAFYLITPHIGFGYTF